MVIFSASTIGGPLISCRKTCLGPKWYKVVQSGPTIDEKKQQEPAKLVDL